MEILPKPFYSKDPAIVAKKLLGKLLVRRLRKERLVGMIVETEAYYGKEDPASRAHSGKPKYCVKMLYDEPGKSLVYMVHGNWLFNVVAHEKGETGAVLIRAVEPIRGIETMKMNRKVERLRELTNGPGKLSKALKITKELNGLYVTRRGSPIVIANNKIKFEVGSSKRIGVTRDLPKNLRFFIKDNRFVSK